MTRAQIIAELYTLIVSLRRLTTNVMLIAKLSSFDSKIVSVFFFQCEKLEEYIFELGKKIVPMEYMG